MYLSVFIYSVEGVGPINVHPIKMLGPKHFNCISYLPVNVYICIPLRTMFAQTGYVIDAFTHSMQTEQEWQADINNPIFLPGIVVLLLTVL